MGISYKGIEYDRNLSQATEIDPYIFLHQFFGNENKYHRFYD